MQYIPIITLVLVVILLGLVIVLLTRKPESRTFRSRLTQPHPLLRSARS